MIINPGSTSTKLSVFENEKEIASESFFHDAPELLKYETVNEQVPMRLACVDQFLKKLNLTPADFDVFVGRGGGAYAQKSGVMPVTDQLIRDTWNTVGGSDHASKLGVLMAGKLQKDYGGLAFTMDPTNVDELDDVARITGIKGVYRFSQLHTLNQRAVAMKHSSLMGKKYKDCRYIVCHIDGGVTVAAHAGGCIIDTTEGAGADGPFAPTRLGAIPVLEVAKWMEQGHTTAEIRKMCSRAGGFVSHFGTSDSDKVHAMVEAGDEHARLVWEAMIYQISKAIGEMSTVLEGRIDAILLTGGLLRFDDIVDGIRRRCGFIAPIYLYPGEEEQEALCHGALRVLRGEEEAHSYTGKPVWDGFAWE